MEQPDDEHRIVYERLDHLRPHPGNPKTHDVPLIRASMRRHGYAATIMVCDRTGMIAAGHGRRAALLAERGQSPKDPPPGVRLDDEGNWLVPVQHGWSSPNDAELLAYVLADNEATRRGGYNEPLLLEALGQIMQTPAGLTGVGFSPDEMATMERTMRGAPKALTDPDSIPDKRDDPVSGEGDLWTCGPHRVMHGDARKMDDYVRLLSGAQAMSGLVLMDPPYGIDIGAKNRLLDTMDAPSSDRASGRVTADLQGDVTMSDAEALWRATFAAVGKLIEPGTPYYVFGPPSDIDRMTATMRASSMPPRHCLVWVKNRAGFSAGRLDYDYQHEAIIYGWRPGAKHTWHADEPQSTVLAYDRPQRSPDHATAKPVDLLERLILNSTEPDDAVLDPFAGSGSTLIAAHRQGRVAYTMDIDRRYVDVVLRRFAAHTDVDPVRQDGTKWSELDQALVG